MAVQYRLYQNNNKSNSGYKKWYARPVWIGTVGMREIADKIQQRSTLTRGDIYAVIMELKDVMKAELLASNRVKIDELGTFKMSFSCSPSDTAEAFTSMRNIRNVKILFQPEMRINAGKRSRPLVEGIKLSELPKDRRAVDGESD